MHATLSIKNDLSNVGNDGGIGRLGICPSAMRANGGQPLTPRPPEVSWGRTQQLTEMARQMALVRETHGKRNLRLGMAERATDCLHGVLGGGALTTSPDNKGFPCPVRTGSLNVLETC